MQAIYVHGLDSSAQSTKGQLLEHYCKQHQLNIEVLRPDLNVPPVKVFATLCSLVETATDQGQQAVLVGSSLGGYFSTLVSNQTGCPAVLLNPSTQPHISLQRFIDSSQRDTDKLNHKVDKEAVVYQTDGGWQITTADLDWFNQHIIDCVAVPNKLYAIIKAGDELLDPSVAKHFFAAQGVTVDWQQGGDHRMSDFAAQLPKVIEHLQNVAQP